MMKNTFIFCIVTNFDIFTLHLHQYLKYKANRFFRIFFALMRFQLINCVSGGMLYVRSSVLENFIFLPYSEP